MAVLTEKVVKRYSLDVNGVDYACVEAGSGPLLLLSHGTFGGKELLLPQLTYLARHFRCVAFDWRGHGESGFNPTGWTHVELVNDLRSLIDGLGASAAFLAGISQGGAISMRLAIQQPHTVLGLVNMCAGASRPPAARLEQLQSFAALLAAEPDENVRRQAVRAFCASSFHAPGFPEREPERFENEVDVFLSHRRDAVSLLPNVPATYDDITPLLGGIRCPTLVLWGEADGRPEMGRIMANSIAGSELVMVADAGHHVNVDAPKICSEAIDSFARSVLNG